MEKALPNPHNPENGPLGLQNGPPGLRKIMILTSQNLEMLASKVPKIMIPTSQNLENATAKLLKNVTVAGYARSALDIYIYIYIHIHIKLSICYLKTYHR